MLVSGERIVEIGGGDTNFYSINTPFPNKGAAYGTDSTSPICTEGKGFICEEACRSFSSEQQYSHIKQASATNVSVCKTFIFIYIITGIFLGQGNSLAFTISQVKNRALKSFLHIKNSELFLILLIKMKFPSYRAPQFQLGAS